MTPQEFVDKWSRSELKESAGAQEHFIDLCRLLGEPTPAEADSRGDEYTFEKGAMKTGGGGGWADVWKRGHFAWEYKGKNKDLDAAFAQLQRYAIALENPPLLIVSDMQRFVIHTNWTNTVQEVHELDLEDLLDASRRRLLEYAFRDPEQLKPKKTRQDLTEEVAGGFAHLALDLRKRGHDPQAVAHFINRLVFCMFAEDVDLLPGKMFTRMLEFAERDPASFEDHSRNLFAAMRSGGLVGFERVDWFNGGLFDDDSTIPLTKNEIRMTLDVARKDWSNIEPSIMGTLFERGLDPDKRSQLGAHYTDRDKIMLIVNPVIVEPLTREWENTRAKIETLTDERERHEQEIRGIGNEVQAQFKVAPGPAKAGEGERRKRITAVRGRATKAHNSAIELRDAFIERLRNFRVLDPACGSGNFLYLSLRALKDLEHRASLDAEAQNLPRKPPQVGPQCLKGIEINPYAAELARVSVWIGEIQWMRANGFSATRNPILKPLDTIECRDALLNEDGSEAEWPQADVIVGNPPFLGAKLMKGSLGVEETERIRTAFKGRLPGFTDLVCYWFEKARAVMVEGRTVRAGFVATNTIAKNTNLPVLRRITSNLTIFDAHSDEPWVIEGAAVRVALISFAKTDHVESRCLDGKKVDRINSNLTSGTDLTQIVRIFANKGRSFLGIQKSGPFDVSGDIARYWLVQPSNPNGKPNSEVLRPYWNGDDLTGRPRDVWFIDIPRGLSEADASLFEGPFGYLSSAPYDPNDESRTLQEARMGARDEHARHQWWEPYWPRPEMRRQIKGLNRYIATPETPTHNVFRWVESEILPDKNLIVFPRSDDTFFGILQSRFHFNWVLRLGSPYGNHPTARRYNSSLVFETFPFPKGLTPDISAADYADDPRAQAIAEAATRLNELRENWLNPQELVDRVPEVVEGYPDRIVPKNEEAAAILKKRTLTYLYNERPAWLDHGHKALDDAVAAAYGWPADLSDEEILERLFQLNQERAANEAA